MRITFNTTCEFGARLAELRAVVAQPSFWPALLPGLEHLGHYWRYGDELYDVRVQLGDEQIELYAECLAEPQRSLTATLRFEDTLITTRTTIVISGEVPWRERRRVRRLIARRVAEACQAVAVNLLHARGESPAPVDVAPAIDQALARRFPHTVAAFAKMHAIDHLERIARLDATWDVIRGQETRRQGDKETRRGGKGEKGRRSHRSSFILRPFSATNNRQFDLVYAGGGLALLHAAVMAQRYGKKVLLFDRGEVGCAHREWNISRVELEALVTTGLFTWDELADVVMNEYERGIVRFHSEATPTDLWLPTVLNVALDAGLLLQLTRRKLEQAGGVVLDHRLFKQVCVEAAGPVRVQVEVENPNGEAEIYHGRLLLDGMGSISPLAMERFAGQPFAGVCPTVGTVVSGLAEGDAPTEHNPRVGDILLSIDNAQRGQQYMWEGFPGRGDELTVYLFYYDTIRGQGSGVRGQGSGRKELDP